MQVDYILVGQGLAGSAVALQLIKRKKTFLIIDNPSKNNSSRIAAGLFNPVTGKNMVKTWLADVIFPYLHNFYRQIENQTQSSFFHSLPLYRPFTSYKEQNHWMAKSTEPAVENYIEKIYTSSVDIGIHNPYGGLLLRHCGYLNTWEYIKATRILISQNATLLEEDFDENELSISERFVQYKNFSAGRIIFCQGVHENKFFNWLPIRALKGETVTVKSEFKENLIINRGLYMLPFDNQGNWRVGSTYNFNDKTVGITSEGRLELDEKLKTLLMCTYQIIDHEWGMRPTVPDHRPVLGAHPVYKTLITFNGLGTKGVSLAPYFSEVLVHWLENKNVVLDKEVDIERFKSLY